MEQTIGQIIREKRTNLNMTQEQLADRVGVTPQAVSKWEKDQAYPDVALLKRIAEILHCTVGELLGEGKETAAAQLIPEVQVDTSKMILRIRVNSNDGDKISVNLPVALIEMVVNNEQLMASVTGDKGDILKNIDFKQILKMVSMGVIGKLVEVESSDGSTIEVYVE